MAVLDTRGHEGRLAAGVAGAAGAAAAALALRRLRQGRSDDGRGGTRAFRLRSDERLAFGLRRVARGRLESALDNLRDPELDEAEAVHEARKDLKKLRSVLRLVRPVLDDDLYARENARYRDAARLLSRTRDAQVRAETIGALADRFAGEPPPGGWKSLRDALAAPESPAGLEELRREAAARIEEGREVIVALGLPGSDADVLRAGIRRTYARGRRRLHEAEEEPSDERLHELRKRAKDLWYHLRLLRPACAPALDPLTERADHLCDLIGADHDLAVLDLWIRDGGGGLDGPVCEHLRRLIAERRLEFRFELFDCAETIYHERPSDFADRLVGLWTAAAS